MHVDTLCTHVKAEVDVVGLPQFLTTLYLEAWFLSLNLELSSAGPSGSRTLFVSASPALGLHMDVLLPGFFYGGPEDQM